MFISINHIPVKRGREADFEKMFLERDRNVEEQPGFISIDILKPGLKSFPGEKPEPVENNEYQVLTRWIDQAAFRAWVQSDAFKKSHAREIDKSIFEGRSYLTYNETLEGAGAQKSEAVTV